jgi:hypothetical protein
MVVLEVASKVTVTAYKFATLLKAPTRSRLDDIPGEEGDSNESEGGKSIANGRTLKSDRGDDHGEEFVVMPEGNQVIMRAIRPDIGRLKLEEVCLVSFS